MTENMAARGEGLAGLVVPPIWRIERCTKHEDYVPDCCLCNEEILTIKTEKAYRAGFKAALEAAAPPSTGRTVGCTASDDCIHECPVSEPESRLDEFKTTVIALWDPELTPEQKKAYIASRGKELRGAAALATPSPQAPQEQCNAFSPTSAREQSSATASVNLSVGDIAMWLDDNLANEEDAPFERRTELMEKAFRMVIEQAAEAGGIAAEAYIENLDDGQVIRAERCAEKVEDAIRGLKLAVPAATQEQPAGSGMDGIDPSHDWRNIIGLLKSTIGMCSDEEPHQAISANLWHAVHMIYVLYGGSPRKVGEDAPDLIPRCMERHPEGGQCELRRGHARQHLAGMVLWGPSSVSVGEQKQEEGV